jgi:hypothetical protein
MPNKDYTLLNIEDTFQDVIFKNEENYLQDGTGSYLNEIKISGSIYADNLYVSQSTIYKSGSTKFGDTEDDTHTFTGSILISGNAYSNGNKLIDNTETGSFLTEYTETDPIYCAESNSLATTGSNTFIGEQIITGSVSIWGDISNTGGAYFNDGKVFIPNSTHGNLQIKNGDVTAISFIAKAGAYHSYISSSAEANFGIGTKTPSEKLEVVGNIIADSFNSNGSGSIIIENRTSDPVSPITGQIWFRTDL